MYKEICVQGNNTRMFIAVKTILIPISENYINKLWCIHVTKYYIAIKVDELDIHVSNK